MRINEIEVDGTTYRAEISSPQGFRGRRDGTQKRFRQFQEWPRLQCSAARREGFAGEVVPGGSIIVRQRGTRIKPGLNVGRGNDDTLFAKVTGKIKFVDKGKSGRFVSVEPAEKKEQTELTTA